MLDNRDKILDSLASQYNSIESKLAGDDVIIQGETNTIIDNSIYAMSQVNYANTYTVAKSGGDFDNIQAAIDSCDANVENRCLVLVYPGVYYETITMRSYVDVVATGSYNDTRIEYTDANVVVPSNNSLLKGFTVVELNSTDARACVACGATSPVIQECYFTGTGSAILEDSNDTGITQDDTYGANWNGQSFQVSSITTKLAAVAVYMDTLGSGTCTLGLYATTPQSSSAKPTGTPLATKSIALSSLTSGAYNTFTFDSAVDVTPSAYYAWVVSVPAGNGSNKVTLYRANGTNPFADAGAVYSSDSGASYTGGTTSDYKFKTYVESTDDSYSVGVTISTGSPIIERCRFSIYKAIQQTGAGSAKSYYNDIYSYAIGYGIDAGTLYSVGNRFTGDGTETDIDIASGATVYTSFDDYDTLTNAGTLIPCSPTFGQVNATTLHATTTLTDHIGEHTLGHGIVADNTITGNITGNAGTVTNGVYTTDANYIDLTDGGATTLHSHAATGANTALSNLASVAINTTLLPATAASCGLGDASKPFSSVYSEYFKSYNASDLTEFVAMYYDNTADAGYMYAYNGSAYKTLVMYTPLMILASGSGAALGLETYTDASWDVSGHYWFHYGLHEISGIAVNDAGGTHNLTLSKNTYTKALLHFNGANGDVTTTEETGKAVTFSATISTAQSKFGGSSANVTAGSMSMLDSADWLFAGDFTLDGCFYFTALPADSKIIELFSQLADSTHQLQFTPIYNNAGTYYMQIYHINGGGATTINVVHTEANLTLNTWHHFEFVRNGNNFYFFLDGTQVGATQVSATALPNIVAVAVLGRQNTAATIYMDEVRIANGYAYHTANFTPRTAEYWQGFDTSGNRTLGFDGALDYAYFADNADFEFGASDGYIVCAVNVESLAANVPLFSKCVNDAANNRLCAYVDTAGAVHLLVGNADDKCADATVVVGTKYIFILNVGLNPNPVLWIYTSGGLQTYVESTSTGCGVNASQFEYGRMTTTGVTRVYGSGTYYPLRFCLGEHLTTNEVTALANEWISGTYGFSGLDYSSTSLTSYPSAASGTEKAFAIGDLGLYSRDTLGVCKVNGGIKLGTLSGDDNYATAVANKYFTRFKCLQDCIITHLAVHDLSNTVNTPCIMAIYSSVNRRPYTMLRQTEVYRVKEDDTENYLIMKLTSPLKLEFGTNYWIAFQSGTNAMTVMSNVQPTVATTSCYWADAYDGTFEDITLAATLTAIGEGLATAAI